MLCPPHRGPDAPWEDAVPWLSELGGHWDGELGDDGPIVAPHPTLPSASWCPGGCSAPWDRAGVMSGASTALTVLSSPVGLKVLKRGRSSSARSPVPERGEKWAGGSEASPGALSWPRAPSLPVGRWDVGGFRDHSLAEGHLHLVPPAMGLIALLLPGDPCSEKRR